MSTDRPRPRWIAIVDRLSVALFVVCWGLVIARLGPSLASNGHWTAIALGALAGYLAADLVSGAVHWLADRYFDPGTAVLGPMLIAPFREHHDDALAITRHDFFEVSGNNGLATLPLAVSLLLARPPASALSTAISCAILGLGLSIFATNLFHRWAHMPVPPRGVRGLQRLRLVLAPEVHALHHDRAHDRAYCVTSGWLNPLLDRYRLFERLERLIDRSIRGRGERGLP